MKEARELQTLLDQLEHHIKAQADEMDCLRKDAMRYRWLRNYSGQMFMATEQQVDDELDRAISGGVK